MENEIPNDNSDKEMPDQSKCADYWTGDKKALLEKAFEFVKRENLCKVAVCKLCTEKKEVKMKDGNTSGIRKHLLNAHSHIYELIYTNNGSKSKLTPVRYPSFKNTSFYILPFNIANCIIFFVKQLK